MSDVIATVWDFDKTLIPGYMQEPIFRHFEVDGNEFWRTTNAEISQYKQSGLDINEDTYYLNRFIKLAQPGQPFDGLNNTLLTELGGKLTFYDGAIDLFKQIHDMNNDVQYREYGIVFENYIVSTGFKKMIEGSQIARYVKKIWGAELIDQTDLNDPSIKRLSEIAYSLDNTTKTRALFEINKGVGIVEGSTIDVNSKIPMENRRVQFCNMVYVADGPSDVPTFSVLNQKGGATMAVYPKGDTKAFASADKLNREDRVQMLAEANYTVGSSAYMWIMQRLKEQANQIIANKKESYRVAPGTPKHQLNSPTL
jgi:hypothetical protein